MLKRELETAYFKKCREYRDMSATLSLCQDKMVILAKERDREIAKQKNAEALTAKWQERFDALLFHGYTPTTDTQKEGEE